MPSNHHRGEIEACFDGRPFRLCLTLGALAELESSFGDDDMLALAERFSRGRISARDATRVIGAGLRGGGHDIADAAVANLRSEHGAAGFVDVVARLLAATFAGPAGAIAAEVVAGAIVAPAAPPQRAPTAQTTRPAPDPFLGGR